MPTCDKREKKNPTNRELYDIAGGLTRNLSADRPILTHGSESDEMVI